MTKKQRWVAKNREHIRAYQREWYRLNREKVIVANGEYAKNNRAAANARQRKRRVKLSEGGYSQQQWNDLVAEWNNRCAYCGAEGRLEADHVHPLSRGGIHDISNILPACRACNASKHNRYCMEWLANERWNTP